MGCAAPCRGSAVLTETPEQALLLAPESGDQRYLINAVFLLLQTWTSVGAAALPGDKKLDLCEKFCSQKHPLLGLLLGLRNWTTRGRGSSKG